MAVAQYRDEVLVTLTSFDAPSSFSIPDRRFFLTKEKPSMSIGRTSKRNSSFEAAKNNAWFDSPVMSRDHAQFLLDVENRKVYIKDIGSLHGTFKNELRIARNARYPMETGDIIRFGIAIERGSDKYPPCTMEARLTFGTTNPEDRPKVFRVPDDSDVEESSSDDDHSIRNSSDILRNTKIRPAAFPSSSPGQSPIDLTVGDQYPLSNVRGADDYNTNALQPIPTTAKPIPQIAYVDLSSPPPEQVTEYEGFSPISPRADWGLEGDEDGDINLSDSTDMDTDSSQEDGSLSQCPVLSSCASDIPNEDVQRDDLDMEEDDFAEQDEFEDGEYGSDRVEEPTSGEHDEILEQFPPPEVSGDVGDGISSLVNNIHEDTEVSTGISSVGATASEAEAQDTLESDNSPMIAVGYMLNPQLPPIEQPKVALPPWVRPSFVQPLRLPSISEAMPPYPPSQNASTTTTAEVMGAKTGKFEYFAARAENKNNALPCGLAESISNSPATQTESPGCPIAPSVMPQQVRTAEPVAPEQLKPTAAEAVPGQAAPSGRLAPSEWAASGVHFLNSPIEETQEPPQGEAPVLDETSAYQYELSKKAVTTSLTPEAPAVEAQAPSTKRTHMEISDILEASIETPNEQSTPRSAKRKAEDISELGPEERGVEETSPTIQKRIRSLAASRRYRLRKYNAPVAHMGASATPDSSTPPPAKRLRRVAEVFGIAALGGVAVMSALIATAPTL
ncbi:hypothetical protein AK830_g4502 [Neonectria ditissima]|uniref:FHA domain-containing protein n=1 Tax=Neonectria ditissima TaxID=78410 RepID=A0A0P7B8B9_9HYPO|nr:hypothetical protein AK830_g4502 [Neonectria ditissima]